MAEHSFFWHDYETFGRVPRRDRPSQFAGLRTDAELNEVGEPVMWFCCPPDDRLPEPEAVLLTGILPQQAQAEGLSEADFAAAIEAELAREGTIGVGYNSIRFDDEVTRHLFWRCLIEPYAREWQNGCSRWDLLDVVRACWALRPEGIEWPVHASGDRAGQPSFKLTDLTAANGLAHDSAHEALSDVRATLALARLIKSRQPKLWDFCLKLRSKAGVMAQVGSGKPFVHLSGMYGVERGCLALVWPLAPHPTNRNEIIVWDLAHDPAALEGLSAETVQRRLYTRQADLPEGEFRLPIKTIHINKSPIVIGNLRTLGAAAERWAIDIAAAQRHAGQAAAIGEAVSHLWPAVFKRPLPEMPPDVDEDLYGGFIGDADRRTLQSLRRLSPQQLATRHPAFEDARLEELLFRYRARNHPLTLDSDEQARWLAHRVAQLHHGAGGATPLTAWFEQVDALADAAIERGDDRAQALLEALVDYAQDLAPPADG